MISSAVFGGNNFGNIQSQFGNAREMLATETARNGELQATIISSENQAKIAEQRYSNGCLILLYKGQMTALSQGSPVYDTVTGKPLPKGTVVCDGYGLTAILEPRDFDGDGKYEPVIAQEAFTGDSEVIGKAIKTNRKVVYK
ncbi:MAG: hypothetical protein KA716_07815 [Gloeotrichia echinulata DEX184]|nr:hypothetical protein [Gloeotrichia echinulata DEX184]